MYDYLIIDGYFGGTGIRNSVEGSYIDLAELNLSTGLTDQINLWLKNYSNEFFEEYKNIEKAKSLDQAGIEIAKKVMNERRLNKIEYYSDATGERLFIVNA
ncbi:hypothetical protein [Leptospira wolffii]|uniref:hypothetical protein n=1 Tax=Leptospira wolffii TaxID=409998 RepID=UPI00058DD8A7|nr:hypothetical protein [Leptospira wolffii]